jgi:hypothetical protein
MLWPDRERKSDWQGINGCMLGLALGRPGVLSTDPARAERGDDEIGLSRAAGGEMAPSACAAVPS